MREQISAFTARLRSGFRIGQSTCRGNRLKIVTGTGGRSFVPDAVRRSGALDLMNRWILLLMAIVSPLHAEDTLRWSTVSGSAGTPLNVVQAGLDSGPGILLLHGFSQSALSWQAQLNDPQLQQAFHLVAVDLRGHGNSAKPWRAEDYSSETWAGDVAAVLAATGLDKPVIVAWSFGGLVAMHYVRAVGSAACRQRRSAGVATTARGAPRPGVGARHAGGRHPGQPARGAPVGSPDDSRTDAGGLG